MSHFPPVIKYHKNLLCHAYHLSKQCRLHFPIINSTTSNYFDLMHIYIWVSIVVHSLDGFQYFLNIVDYFTLYTWTFLMHPKYEARTHIQNFNTYCHTQFSCQIKTTHNDNDTKFIMPSYYAS